MNYYNRILGLLESNRARRAETRAKLGAAPASQSRGFGAGVHREGGRKETLAAKGVETQPNQSKPKPTPNKKLETPINAPARTERSKASGKAIPEFDTASNRRSSFTREVIGRQMGRNRATIKANLKKPR